MQLHFDRLCNYLYTVYHPLGPISMYSICVGLAGSYTDTMPIMCQTADTFNIKKGAMMIWVLWCHRNKYKENALVRLISLLQ
jgi:hypothetical protein